MEKCFKRIEVNNQRYLELKPQDNGMQVVTVDAKGSVENTYVVSDGEIVMLLNYYCNCKSGSEKSDYIAPSKRNEQNDDSGFSCFLKKLLERVQLHDKVKAYTSFTMVENGVVDLSALLNLCGDLEDYAKIRHNDAFANFDTAKLTRALAVQCDKMEFIICNSMEALGLECKEASHYLHQTDEELEESILFWVKILKNKKERLRPVIAWLESEGMNLNDAARSQKSTQEKNV